MKRLEVFDLWCCRRMLNIFCNTRTSNEEILDMMKCDRTLPNSIKTRKPEYFGQIIRGLKYLLIIHGKVEGKMQNVIVVALTLCSGLILHINTVNN